MSPMQFQGKPEHVARWLVAMAKEVDALVAPYGVEIDELIGRRDLLKVRSGGRVDAQTQDG